MGFHEFTGEELEKAPNRLGYTPPRDRIKLAVAIHFSISIADLDGDNRLKTIALARHVAMYLIRQHTRASYPEIGRSFHRDHTTIIAAVAKIQRLIDGDRDVATIVTDIEDDLRRRGA